MSKKHSSADNHSQSDAYQRMYEKQLKKFQDMDNEPDGEIDSDLHFYTEEELAAIEQAKRDAAKQAYQDAYAQQYSKSRKQYSNTSDGVHGVHGEKRAMPSSSQRYARQAQKNKKKQQVEFGSNNSYNKSKKNKKHSGSSIAAGIFKWIIIILIIIVLLIQLLIYRYISMVNIVDKGERLVTDASMSSASVTNILLIGSDTRDEEERGRTDSMILLSLNSQTDEITMTSFMRDSYVEIPGHGWAKLNAAYAYGGAELLMDTIELNFDIEVEKYAYVNFFSFVDIVDSVGGIEIDLSDEEAQYMTDPLAEQNKYLGNEKGTDYLAEGGDNVHLNGNQALAYARLRYVGNADFERTERQRTVITKIIEKAKTLNILDLDNFFKVSASEISTNMTKGEMYVLVYKLLFSLRYDTEQLRIPQDGAYSYGTHDSQSTLDLDFDACKKELRSKIYN